MATAQNSEKAHEPNKLVLCFDGTGNSFSGSNTDTNVVKILNNLDRHCPHQYHYYQTGIGTYDINEKSVHKTWLGEIRSNISQTIDQGLGTTFDAHVMAGYRFLMRYHKAGDRIYMFGFSRGAFTAKFLARMIYTVGLLCKGNEEMVPFAYRLYQRYLAGEVSKFKDTHRHTWDPRSSQKAEAPASTPNGIEEPYFYEYEHAKDEISAFSNTFCRKEHTEEDGKVEETNVKVYFLGIWDCVNSVSVLERSTPMPVPVKGTARYVRHAVAVDEARVKFKPALVAQDIRDATQSREDIKEVWFPGCHGDIGGGWPAALDDILDVDGRVTLRQRCKMAWGTSKAKASIKNVRAARLQLSDIALSWMIREVELVGEKDPTSALKWCRHVNAFKQRYELGKEQAMTGHLHRSLHFGHGTGFFAVLLWKFMEYLPTTTRWELEDEDWVNIRFPLNKGQTRDIPSDATLHESLLWRLRNLDDYSPQNNHGGRLRPCLKDKGNIAHFSPVIDTAEDPNHQTFVFSRTKTG